MAAGLACVAVQDNAHAERLSPSLIGLLPHMQEGVLRSVAPRSRRLAPLISLPDGVAASSLGLEEVSPGVGRLYGDPDRVQSFQARFPHLRAELAPALRLLVDRAGSVTGAYHAHRNLGVRGNGAFVGIADTGLDVRHEDFRDPITKRTRVRWLLDFSRAPRGVHAALESRFKSQVLKDAGAVFDSADLDAALAANVGLPTDEIGHGTHVASIAAGNGGGSSFVGVAPEAELLIVRLATSDESLVENDDVLRGIEFLFDRATFEGRPVAVNLSLGTDFGPHDGSMLWQQVLAAHVGPSKPGRALVVAAGNSGSVAEFGFHESVFVTEDSPMVVPVLAGAVENGGVEVWLTFGSTTDVRVGLDGPDGEVVAPIGPGENRGARTGRLEAGVIHGAAAPDSPVPPSSRGAVVAWSGKSGPAQYGIRLEGRGRVDLYLQGTGDMGYTGARFAGGVRQGTINLPGDHPGILAVGCSISRSSWTSIDGVKLGLRAPRLDAAGMSPIDGMESVQEGDVCWFSSAGPNALGAPKPELLAPGAAIVGAMSRHANPGDAVSIFTYPSCPRADGGASDRCLQVDENHAVSQGTSMSSPMVAGAVALLLSQDAMLTQDRATALLQSGAQRWRRTPRFYDQASVGELDIEGALARLRDQDARVLAMPSPARSWLGLSLDYAPADGSLPIVAHLELRTDNGEAADGFDASSLRLGVWVAGTPLVDLHPTRVAAGLYRAEVSIPAGRGGETLLLLATLSGIAVANPITLPIAVDPWRARYPATLRGGCALAKDPSKESTTTAYLVGISSLMLVLTRWIGAYRRRRFK